MANYNYFRKTEADSLKKIELSFLRKHGYLSHSQSGNMVWSNNYDDNKSTIGIQTHISDKEEGYLRIWYSQTNQDTQERKEFDYKVSFTSTPCNYGGYRSWFICPCSKNNRFCGKRVGVLYKDGEYFACRHCYKLTYASRNLSGISKIYGSISDVDVQRARERVKRVMYNGRYTRKFKRYLQIQDKHEDGFLNGFARLDRDVRRFKR